MPSFRTRTSILVALLLCGCANLVPPPTPTPAPSSTPTHTRLPTPTRHGVTPTIAPSNTPTHPFTRMPTPTATPTRAFTPTRTATPWPPPSGSSECTVYEFYTESLGRSMRFFLYLPVGYYTQNQRRYPVIYLLSGLGGSHYEWPTYGVCTGMDQLIHAGRAQPMIVVMPSGNDNPAGGLGSYWINHAPPPLSDGKRWGDYIWKDLVNYIDAQYRTLPHRASRAIGGLSAGGQGALTLAFTHPEVFSVVGAHSPSFRRADGSVAAFGDPAYYQQYDPIWLAQNTQTWRDLAIWLDDGDADDQWGTAIRGYHDMLTALDIPHEWRIFPGTHDPSYWSPLAPTYLRWYSTKLTGQ
ncbi:MAG: alpha/beta hydrolase-fold protein [Chloroflexota bacterium]